MLNVESLSVHYGDAQALDGVSLTVDEGAIVAIVASTTMTRIRFRRTGVSPECAVTVVSMAMPPPRRTG